MKRFVAVALITAAMLAGAMGSSSPAGAVSLLLPQDINLAAGTTCASPLDLELQATGASVLFDQAKVTNLAGTTLASRSGLGVVLDLGGNVDYSISSPAFSQPDETIMAASVELGTDPLLPLLGAYFFILYECDTSGHPVVITKCLATEAGVCPTDAQDGVRFAMTNFVKHAYHDFLDRVPTTPELTAVLPGLIDGSTTRASFVNSLANSNEWVSVFVQGLYQNTLGRAGDTGGVSYWTNQILTHKRTPSNVASFFYASPEYFRGIGGGTNATWVADLYTKLLGRTADTAGKAYWVGQVVAHGRPNVAKRFFDSQESREARVSALYDRLLDRAPDAAGLAYWADKILTKGDISLSANLAASSEYFHLAQKLAPLI